MYRWSKLCKIIVGQPERSLPDSANYWRGRVASNIAFLAPSTLCRKNVKTEVSLWRRIKCFPPTLRRRNSKTRQSPVMLDLCFKKTWSEKSHDHRDAIVFEKLRFQNVFRPQENEKPMSSVFKFLRCEEPFPKALFSWRISVDSTPNRRNEAAFSNFSGVYGRCLSSQCFTVNSSDGYNEQTSLIMFSPNVNVSPIFFLNRENSFLLYSLLEKQVSETIFELYSFLKVFTPFFSVGWGGGTAMHVKECFFKFWL